MSIRTIDQVDNRIARLQTLMKRLRAERRVAVLREKHHNLKFNSPGISPLKGQHYVTADR